MSTKERAKRESRVVSAQGMIENAPSKGNKGTYLKLLPGLKFFMPEVNKTYRLIFFAWKAGDHNPSGKKGTWVTNRFIPVHRDVGPNNDKFLCSAKAFQRPCPVCEEFQRLRTAGKDWDTIKNLRPQNRELFLVHDLDGDKNNLQIWDESTFLFGDHLREKIAAKPSTRNLFADPDKGKIIEVIGKKKKIGTGDCTEFSSIEFEDRDPVSDELLAKADKFCLDLCPIEMDYEKLSGIFGQTGGAQEDEEVEKEEEAEEQEEPTEEEVEEETEEEAAEEEETEEEAEEEAEEEEEVEETEEEVEEEEEEVIEEEEEPEPEEEAPPPPPKKKPAAPAAKPAAKPAAPAPKPAPKPAAKPAAPTGKKK